MNIFPEYAARVLGNQKIYKGEKITWRISTNNIIKKVSECTKIMEIALNEKFTQSEYCRNILLSTTRYLVCKCLA